MSDYYLSNAIDYAKSIYGVHFNKNSITLPQQIFLLKDKLNCPVLGEFWESFLQSEHPAWMLDVN